MVRRIIVYFSLLSLAVSVILVTLLLQNPDSPKKVKKSDRKLIIEQFESKTRLLEWAISEIEESDIEDEYYMLLF